MSITEKRCKIDGCLQSGNIIKGREYLTKGFCRKHYWRYWKYGDASIDTRFDSRAAILKDGVAYIPLGINAQSGYAIVDKEYSSLDTHKWYLSDSGYAITRVNSKNLRMHHFIIGKPKGDNVTDHINRNRIDNRACNLRHVTRAENNRNSGIRSDSRSKIQYISDASLQRPATPWHLRIKREGKWIINKRYALLEDALTARDTALASINDKI